MKWPSILNSNPRQLRRIPLVRKLSQLRYIPDTTAKGTFANTVKSQRQLINIVYENKQKYPRDERLNYGCLGLLLMIVYPH